MANGKIISRSRLNIVLMKPDTTSQQIDLNYGVGEHIQLTLQTAPVLLKRSGHGLNRWSWAELKRR